MTRAIHLYFIALTLAFTCLSACSETPPRPAAKFAGRLLLLSGSSATGADLMELTPSADGQSYNLSTITSGVIEATASADQKQILYTTKSEITAVDLQSPAVSGLAHPQVWHVGWTIKNEGYCLAWSPDAKKFSYKQSDGKSTKLYVSDLEGKTKLIWEDSSGVEHDAVRYCAQWVAPDRIVFDRFVGMIPKQATSESLKPNSTTVATVGDSVKFVDGERKWSIQGVCPSGNVLVSPADQAQPILVARTTDNFAKLNPTPASSEGRFIGFAARSCVPFFMSQSLSTTTDLFSLNPTNWQRLRTTAITYTFSLNAKFLIKSSAKLMIAGDAPDKLLLIDTESGDVTPLTIAGNAKPISPVPIVWLE